MSIDQENIVVENVFTDEEISSIYNTIKDVPDTQTHIVPIYCQKAYHCNMPTSIVDKVTSIANNISQNNLRLTEISFASYSKEYGDLPLLSPHFDNTFNEKRFTLDVQLKSNIDWPLVVRGNEYLLKDNEALTFSGTHQSHWRTFKKFKDGDFIDMLFCHFSQIDNSEPISLEEHKRNVAEWFYYANIYYQDIIKGMDIK